jgi:hypothetical protein
LLLFILSCSRNDSIDKDKLAGVIKNYYLLYKKDVKGVEDLVIDSIVPVTKKRQIENSIRESEKKYYYFIEAKDDEYADSTARDIEKLEQELTTAENKRALYYTVYYRLKFIASDMSPRKRQSNLDITSDYKIRPNEVTEKDKTEGIKGEKIFKEYSY